MKTTAGAGSTRDGSTASTRIWLRRTKVKDSKDASTIMCVYQAATESQFNTNCYGVAGQPPCWVCPTILPAASCPLPPPSASRGYGVSPRTRVLRTRHGGYTVPTAARAILWARAFRGPTPVDCSGIPAAAASCRCVRRPVPAGLPRRRGRRRSQASPARRG